MRPSIALVAAAIAAVLAACGPGSPGGPTMNNRMNQEPEEDAPAIQSNDILARDARGNRTKVKHILIGWKGRQEAETQDARARSRTREEADALAVQLLKRARDGESFDHLMAEFSEDPGSADDGQPYEVSPDAKLVFEFKRMGLRLDVGESGLVLSKFGWHIMKRVE
jgi:hypothetical protein